MGRDKALLPLPPDRHGQTLGQAVAGIVESAAGSATLVGDTERYRVLGYPVIPDRYPGEGPLGGILTALAHSSANWNLITACDMPGLTVGFLRQLLDAAASGEADILLPFGPSGRPEVLCAVYRKRAITPLEGAFRAGIRKVALAASASAGLRTVPFHVAEASVFQNVNTPEEWAAHGSE